MVRVEARPTESAAAARSTPAYERTEQGNGRGPASVDAVTEHPLEGGIANAGQVVRVGAHVVRPASPHTAAIHTFLRALRHDGFTGAPLPLSIEPDGRERLEFIPGDVPSIPHAAWSQPTLRSLRSVDSYATSTTPPARSPPRATCPGTTPCLPPPAARSSVTTISNCPTSCSGAVLPSHCPKTHFNKRPRNSTPPATSTEN